MHFLLLHCISSALYTKINIPVCLQNLHASYTPSCRGSSLVRAERAPQCVISLAVSLFRVEHGWSLSSRIYSTNFFRSGLALLTDRISFLCPTAAGNLNLEYCTTAVSRGRRSCVRIQWCSLNTALPLPFDDCPFGTATGYARGSSASLQHLCVKSE
jgi:hypothetical protein